MKRTTLLAMFKLAGYNVTTLDWSISITDEVITYRTAYATDATWSEVKTTTVAELLAEAQEEKDLLLEEFGN